MRYLALIFGLLPAFANAQEITKPRLTVLNNGLRIIAVEDHKSPLVSAVWSVRAGAITEPSGLAGISHLVEHLVNGRGTAKYPSRSVAAVVSGQGGHADARTSHDTTTFEIVLHSKDLDQVLSMHEQMMFRAVFDDKGSETEKMAVFEELRADRDRPDLYVWDTAPQQMYPAETFYSRSAAGSIENIKAITAQRAQQYYRDYYVSNNITLAVVGDFDTHTLLAKIASRFAGYKRRNIPPHSFREIAIRPGVTVVTEERDVNRSYFLLAFEGPEMSSPDYLPFEVLMRYVGGDSPTAPLYKTLVRKRAVLLEISASPLRRRFNRGWQPFTGEGEPEKIAAGIDGLFEVLSEVRARGISPEDLALTKKRIVKAHRVALTSGLSYATALAESDAHGDYGLVAEYEDRIGRVTAQDVWTAAKKYFRPEHFFLMVLFPRGKTPAAFADDVKRSTYRYAQPQMSGVVSRVLEDGATLIHELRPGSHVDSFTVAVKAGEKNDGRQPGLADATATMMRRLTRRRPPEQLQAFLDRVGVVLSGSTDRDGTIFTLSVPTSEAETTAKLIKEILFEPSFPMKAWEAERRSLVPRAISKLDDPREVAKGELLAQLYHQTAYRTWLADYKRSLERVSPVDLTAFHRTFYRPERIAIAYVGRAPLDVISAALSGQLGAPPASREPNGAALSQKFPEGPRRKVVQMPGKEQVSLYWAWPGPKLGSDDWIFWLLAQRALGGDESSRLWQLRQEEGLAYEISCDSVELSDGPLVTVYMAFAKEKYKRAVAALERKITRVLKEGISSEDLERVRGAFVTSLERFNQTAAQRSDRLATAWLKGLAPDRWERLLKLVSSATVDSVNRVLRQTLSMERVMKVEVGAVAPN